MKTLIAIMVVFLLAGGIASASDFSLRNIAEHTEWSALWGTRAGEGICLSAKFASIQGYHQYFDGAWNGQKLFAGASSEFPWVRQMLAIDRVGFGVWVEGDAAVGIVAIRVIH